MLARAIDERRSLAVHNGDASFVLANQPAASPPRHDSTGSLARALANFSEPFVSFAYRAFATVV